MFHLLKNMDQASENHQQNIPSSNSDRRINNESHLVERVIKYLKDGFDKGALNLSYK